MTNAKGSDWQGVGVLAAIFLALVLLHPQRLQVPGAIFAAATAVLGLYPLMRFLRAQQPEPLPFLAALGAFYGVSFGVAAFLTDIIWPNGEPILVYLLAPSLWSLSNDAMAAMFVGASSLLIAALAGSTALRRIMPALPVAPARSEDFGLLLLVRLGIGGMAGAMTGILFLPAFLGFLLIVRNRRVGMLMVLAVCTVVMFGYGPLNVFRASIDEESRTAGFSVERYTALFLETPRLVMMKSDFSLVAAARCSVRLPEGEASPLYQSCVQGEYGSHYDPPGSDWSALGAVLRQSFKRINQTALFALVYERTPSPVPHWDGETLRPLLTSMVPRALWPSKPEERAGQAFGRRYDLIAPSDGNMSVNLSVLVEAFASFGWPGLAGAGCRRDGSVPPGQSGLQPQSDSWRNRAAVDRFGASDIWRDVAGSAHFPFISAIEAKPARP
ncbi:MAG: hypothetical protein H7X89_11235 [Rhizobiales bacterium]|nr:hypothetical protein [Hyphomicrobiales bacterium]